jgi:cytochrome oxidase assembly protein ShyY1
VLVTPGPGLPPSLEWRRVEVTGRYDVVRQLVVRNREFRDDTGYDVLTPLVTRSGTALLVNRGWVPRSGAAAAGPAVAPPPSGEVTVVGRLRASEHQQRFGPRDGPGVPAGQVVRIEVPRIARSLPYPVYGGYVELTEQRPSSGDAPQPLDLPELSDGPHLAYAIQWWFFAVIAVAGVIVMARREAYEGHAPPPATDSGTRMFTDTSA